MGPVTATHSYAPKTVVVVAVVVVKLPAYAELAPCVVPCDDAIPCPDTVGVSATGGSGVTEAAVQQMVWLCRFGGKKRCGSNRFGVGRWLGCGRLC